MKTYKLETNYGTYEVQLKKAKYSNNDTLAILIETTDGEPFADLTVDLIIGMANDTMAYVDTNNCPWAKKFIETNNLGVPTRFIGFGSGFCQYPLYIFNEEALNQMATIE